MPRTVSTKRIKKEVPVLENLEQTSIKKSSPKKKKVPAKKSPTPVKRKLAPSGEPSIPFERIVVPSDESPLVPNRPAKTMRPMTSFFFGGLVCILGTVALALFLALVLLPPLIGKLSKQEIVTAAGGETSELAQPKPPIQDIEQQNQEFGFYGTLLSRQDGVLSVKELKQPLPLEEKAPATEAKTYLVRTSAQTEFTYQRPRPKNDTSSALFVPEQGSLDGIKDGMFVFVATPDDTASKDTLNASHILYSEESPFAE